jgi:hypothetical protein
MNYCSDSIWDTGNPISYVTWAPQPSPLTSELPGGSAVRVTIGSMGSLDLIVGANPMVGVDEIVVEPAVDGFSYINLGLSLFLHYDALFDQENGVVGLAPH